MRHFMDTEDFMTSECYRPEIRLTDSDLMCIRIHKEYTAARWTPSHPCEQIWFTHVTHV